jgi:hypothetical protein
VNKLPILQERTRTRNSTKIGQQLVVLPALAEMIVQACLTSGKLIKKKIKFSSFKEIQSGAVAKLYIGKGYLIYEEMRKYFPIYEEAVSHKWLCNGCSTLNFLIYEENFIFFFYQYKDYPLDSCCRGEGHRYCSQSYKGIKIKK